MSYADFLTTKAATAAETGPLVDLADVHPMLHDWQAEIVQWAASVGRAALWADTGLGKTLMQIEWARHVVGDGTALIIAPLAVCHQTIREAAKIGVHVNYVRDGAGLTPGIYITNYETVEHFDSGELRAVVLDEASILKQSDGKTRTALINQFRTVPFRLACTATPAPNDPEELTNQSEFLGHSTRVNMLAAYFVHDQDGWRLKGHARRPMMRWMATWAIALRRPSDLGYPDDGYVLPGLEIIPHLIDVEIESEGQLFATELGGVGGRAQVRRSTLKARVDRAVQLVHDCAAASEQPEIHQGAHHPRCSLSAPQSGNEVHAGRPAPDDDEQAPEHHACRDQWLIWCGLNDEQDALVKALGDECRSIDGRTRIEDRIRFNEEWIAGDFRILVVKPGMYSFGMNWQHCARMAFVGLSDSYEAYYQSIRRCYRYGQSRVVQAHVILSALERQIADNIARKERESSNITAALVEEMRRTRTKETP